MARLSSPSPKSAPLARPRGRPADGRTAHTATAAGNLAQIQVDLAIAISRLYGAAVRSFNAAAKDSGASFEQWLVLSEVSGREAVTMGELARALGINLSTLTRIVDRMVSASLLYRSIDPQDRRRVVLVVSDAGQALRARLQSRLTDALVTVERLDEVLESSTPSTLRALIDVLESGA